MPTTLPTKIGVKEGSRSILLGAPKVVTEALSATGAKVGKTLSGSFQYIHLFVQTHADLDARFPELKKHLAEGGMLWISWPKGWALGTDLSLRRIIETGYRHGMVESKTISVDETWSAIKFTFPIKGKEYKNSYGKLPPSPAGRRAGKPIRR